MQLYLDSFGAYLGIDNAMFWLKPKSSNGQHIAVRKVKCIFATRGVQVSSDAILMALDNGIPFIFIDNVGRSLGYIWGGQFGSVSTVRKKQALFSGQHEGMEWVRGVLTQRLERQIESLQLIRAHFKDKNMLNEQFDTAFADNMPMMERQLKRWQNWLLRKNDSLDDIGATYRGMEGTGSRHYFQTISTALPEIWQFEKRAKRPAYDSFNALLNYLYGMLYPMVELGLIKSGLDPYMGVHHTDRYNRPTMVYDCIELYRHWAERVAVLGLAMAEKLDPDKDFQVPTELEGVRLANSGKQLVIGTMLEFMEGRELHGGQLRKRSTHIDLDAVALATRLRGE